MKAKTDKDLKSVISLLREMTDHETMKPELKEAISKQVKVLRRALRTRDPVKTKEAVGQLSRLFLRAYEGRAFTAIE